MFLKTIKTSTLNIDFKDRAKISRSKILQEYSFRFESLLNFTFETKKFQNHHQTFRHSSTKLLSLYPSKFSWTRNSHSYSKIPKKKQTVFMSLWSVVNGISRYHFTQSQLNLFHITHRFYRTNSISVKVRLNTKYFTVPEKIFNPILYKH